MIYQEIDYYLMELFEQKQLKNEINVKEIKAQLTELYNQWQLHQQI